MPYQNGALRGVERPEPDRTSLTNWYWCDPSTHSFGHIGAHLPDGTLLISHCTRDGHIPPLTQPILGDADITIHYFGYQIMRPQLYWVFFMSYDTARAAAGFNRENQRMDETVVSDNPTTTTFIDPRTGNLGTTP